MAQYKNSGVRLDGEAADRSLTGIAAVWANFDQVTGSGRDSTNVSSYTDNGAGLWAVNFTSNFANDDFAGVADCAQGTETAARTLSNACNQTTSDVDVFASNSTPTATDRALAQVICMGDLA